MEEIVLLRIGWKERIEENTSIYSRISTREKNTYYSLSASQIKGFYFKEPSNHDKSYEIILIYTLLVRRFTFNR